MKVLHLYCHNYSAVHTELQKFDKLTNTALPPQAPKR